MVFTLLEVPKLILPSRRVIHLSKRGNGRVQRVSMKNLILVNKAILRTYDYLSWKKIFKVVKFKDQ
jgi:hypothetical protein